MLIIRSGSKLKNVPTVENGIRFHSKKEAKRYKELLLMELAGEITELKLQPEYRLIVNDIHICTYISDFKYFDCKLGKFIVEDTKGHRTKDYIIKIKLAKALFPGTNFIET